MLFSWYIARNSRCPGTTNVNDIHFLMKKECSTCWMISLIITSLSHNLFLCNFNLSSVIFTSNLNHHQDEKSTLIGTRSNWCLKLDSKNLQCLDALSLSNHFVFFLHAFTLVSNWDCLGLHSLSTWGMNKYVIMHTLYVYQILPPPSPPP